MDQIEFASSFAPLTFFFYYYWSAAPTTTTKTQPAASIKSELKQFAVCLHYVKLKMQVSFLL